MTEPTPRPLSQGQLDVLRWLCLGKSLPTIATIAGLPVSLVRSRCKELRVRLGADTIGQACFLAAKRGWID